MSMDDKSIGLCFGEEQHFYMFWKGLLSKVLLNNEVANSNCPVEKPRRQHRK